MIRRWEKEFNECAKRKRKRAHCGKDREVVKHVISQEVFDFIKTKDILHELIHPRSGDKENIPINGAWTQVMPRPPQDFNMDSLLEDMDSMLEPILMQDFEMNSLLEPNDTLIEDMDSLLEPSDSMIEPIDTLIEDMDSLLEPIDSLTEHNDTLIEDMDSLLEPIAFNNSSNIDEFNEMVCRLDSLLELVVLVERC